MKTKRNIKILHIFFALLLLVSVVMGGRVILPAFADTTQYTSVLEDLQTDENFNVDEYPDNVADYAESEFAQKEESFYSIHVIQIAESTDGELFLYTYQPSQKTQYLVATEINMSLTDKLGKEVAEDEEMSPIDRPRLYGLELLSSDGVFCKYKVNDFFVSDQDVRYYNIASIYREWLKDIDEETGNDTTINAVAFAVGKRFRAVTQDGVVLYACENRKVVRILNPFWGYQRYSDGFLLKTTACDSHYVAFSTDWEIDELYEADVSYQSRGVHKYYNMWEGTGYRYDEWQSQYAFLTDEQEFVKDRTGWLWGSEKKYKRIQSTNEFMKSEKLNDNVKEDLARTEWVLRFVETDFVDNHDSRSGNWTEVSNVAVLRLKFKSAGVVYNLGAVSDKGTESPIPTNPPETFNFWRFVWNCIVKLFKGTANFIETVVAVVAIFVCVLLVPILLLVLSIVFPSFGAVMKIILKGIGKGLLWLLKGLWWLICLPFKGIAALVRKCRGE